MQSIRNRFRQMIQAILFWWVKVPQNPHHTDLDQLKNTKHCVYVLEHQSTSDALVADHVLTNLGLHGLYQKIDIPELIMKPLF